MFSFATQGEPSPYAAGPPALAAAEPRRALLRRAQLLAAPAARTMPDQAAPQAVTPVRKGASLLARVCTGHA